MHIGGLASGIPNEAPHSLHKILATVFGEMLHSQLGEEYSD